jgi:hypothetical protein
MFAARLVLLILHIAAAAISFGGTLGLARLIRAGASAGPSAFQVAVRDAARRAVLGRLSGVVTLLSGVGLVLLRGGFAVVPKNYHVALGLMWLLLGIQFFVTTPAVKRVRALAEGSTLDPVAVGACARLIGIGVGAGHALWLLILVLMFHLF